MQYRKFGLVLAALTLSLGLLSVAATPARACPRCAEAVGVASEKGDTSKGDPASGFNYSIYMMIGTMIVVGLGMGRLMYVVVKQVNAEHAVATDTAIARIETQKMPGVAAPSVELNATAAAAPQQP